MKFTVQPDIYTVRPEILPMAEPRVCGWAIFKGDEIVWYKSVDPYDAVDCMNAETAIRKSMGVQQPIALSPVMDL